MKGFRNSHKGFTLVEIMIVVVIIGLLAAMAIPAFQKVRRNSVGSARDNDARQMAAGAQQYYLEHGTTHVLYSYDSATGAVTGPLSDYVKVLSKKYTMAPVGSLAVDSTFSISHPVALPVLESYNPEGQRYTP